MTGSSVEPASVSVLMGKERTGITHKLEIQDVTHGGVVEGYITGNLAQDGTLKEVFLHGMGKEGSTLDGWTQFSAILLSLGLQAGVDFASLAKRVAAMKFEPYGPTSNSEIPWAPSIPAYILAWLALRFGDVAVKAEIREVIAEWG